jgi:hypothetical protein
MRGLQAEEKMDMILGAADFVQLAIQLLAGLAPLAEQ